MERLQQLQRRLQRTLPMANLAVQPLPGCPEIRLALINSDFPTGPLPPDVMHAVIARPAYWAFCWGSGLGLARALLDAPEYVAGRQVLDLGSGSGVAGIAAKLAGASRVTACDIDADACLASALNAELNGVSIEVVDALAKVPEPVDVVLMADVLYDRANLPLLDAASALRAHVIVADSRIRDLERSDFTPIFELQALTFPNLGEFDEFRTVRLFEQRQGHRAANRSPAESA
jgi:predicted nicotinamide N-methyase